MSGCSVQCLCGSVVCVWQRDWFISNLLVQYMCCRRCFSCLMGPGIAWQLQRLCRTSDRGPLWLISPVSVLPPLLQLLVRSWHSCGSCSIAAVCRLGPPVCWSGADATGMVPARLAREKGHRFLAHYLENYQNKQAQKGR